MPSASLDVIDIDNHTLPVFETSRDRIIVDDNMLNIFLESTPADSHISLHVIDICHNTHTWGNPWDLQDFYWSQHNLSIPWTQVDFDACGYISAFLFEKVTMLNMNVASFLYVVCFLGIRRFGKFDTVSHILRCDAIQGVRQRRNKHSIWTGSLLRDADYLLQTIDPWFGLIIETTAWSFKAWIIAGEPNQESAIAATWLKPWLQ